ncbi:MAG: phosphoglycerate dehydrogenase [Gemmatimonadetes bacterium]|nr:phosphoglycerate dehydrogenase [Gemmatimonadota bacterium]
MHRIIVLDKLAREGLDRLARAEEVTHEVRTGLGGAALRDALLEYDGAICRSEAKITADALKGNRRLRGIVRAGVGTDNIDRAAATRQGIVVMNTPTGNTLSTAEHTFTLMAALSRNIAPANRSLLEGRWDRGMYTGVQLAGKTLGIIGMGRIGREVAARARAFAMRVIGFDPFLSPEQAGKLGVEYVDDVRDLLPEVDYLTVHTPLTPETRHLVSHGEIDLLKPGARLVNCARGGIYDEEALIRGLESGKLAGVALDVYEEEPCVDSPLFRMPGVLCTPHLGASTEEAQADVAVEAVDLLVNFLVTGEVRHAVNAVTIDSSTFQTLGGYLDVAYRLGILLSQWHSGGPRACRLTYRGKVVDENTRLLTSAFCAGLLEHALDEEVNIINGEMLLRERGIQLTEETRSAAGFFTSAISVEIDCAGETFRADGTVFGNNMPRLIRLGDHRMEAYLDGNLLVFNHSDVPGIVGAIGDTFGRYKVNIAQMAVGRLGNKPGGKAVGVLNLDDVPPQESIDEILRHPAINGARFIRLPAHGALPPWMPG